MKCYLCKAATRPYLYKNEYELYRCPACGLIQTDLKENYAQFVKRYYGKGYFAGKQEFGAYANYLEDKPYITRNLQKFVNIAKTYKKSGKLLDVGCAMGFLIELASKAGFDAYGIEPSDYAYAQAYKKFGNKITKGTVDSAKYPSKTFDVIVLSDVIEHLADPAADLKKLARFLKDDGIFLIATGNIDSLAAKILGRRWTFFSPPQHLFFFNHQTMKELLNQAGLAFVKSSTIGKWLSLRYIFHLARAGGESKFAAQTYPLLKILKLDQIPLYLPMHDNMILIARKI